MHKNKNPKHLLAAIAMAAAAGAAHAAPIAIFNTGVDDAGAPLAENAPDRHYTLVAPGAATGTPFATTSAGGFPVGPWIGDSAVSAWISPAADTNGVEGVYIYRTTFDLTGFDPATAIINGRWAADNTGLEIYVNALATGHGAEGFSSWSDFSLTDGFVAGFNTLDFALSNLGGPTGLRVEFLVATAERVVAVDAGAVPEPGSLALAGAALAWLGLRRRKAARAG